MASLKGDDETLGEMSVAMMHAPQAFRGPSAYSYNLRDTPLKAGVPRRRLREKRPSQQQQQGSSKGKGPQRTLDKGISLRESQGQPLAGKAEAHEAPVFAFSPRAAQLRGNETPAIKIKKTLIYSTTQSYRLAGKQYPLRGYRVR